MAQQLTPTILWNTIKRDGYAELRVSHGYAPTLLNSLRCIKWRDNAPRKALGLPPFGNTEVKIVKKDGLYRTLRITLLEYVPPIPQPNIEDL